MDIHIQKNSERGKQCKNTVNVVNELTVARNKGDDNIWEFLSHLEPTARKILMSLVSFEGIIFSHS